jgi:hypothetical protein
MARLRDLVSAHPRLSAWVVLAILMNLILAFTANNVGLAPLQWLALIVATTLVAGACVWLIGGADEPEGDGKPQTARPTKDE